MIPPMPPITEEDTAEPFRCDIDRTLGTDVDRAQRNAFAEEGLRTHRHRLAGNAFYQEAYAARKNTPPTMNHPALRYNTDLYNISQKLPQLSPKMASSTRPSLEMQEVSPLHARSSRNTTMSPFINAGFEERVPSPPLKLVPSPHAAEVPTLRNTYDERSTDTGHQEGDDFITVTRYSPKVTRQEVGRRHSQQPDPSNKKNVPASPKRSLLDRFRVARRDGVPAQPLPSLDTANGSPSMPAKARAVLVTMPPNQTVARSPSKSKHFWLRRNPSVKDDAKEHTPLPALKAPPHAANHPFRRDELPGYTRSHSLGYVDDTVPPTPPSKDTPPDEKARQEAATAAMIVSQEDSTPTRKKGFLSLTDRISPNRFGGYGRRGNAKLVTQASTHSLRASVVPNAMDGRAFQDTKHRIDGLGLEGFSLPEENRQDVVPYSPSIYSPYVSEESMGTFASTTDHRRANSESTFLSSTDHIRENSECTSDTGISDLGDIPIFYPELARDPSMAAFMTPDKIVFKPDVGSVMDRSFSETLRQDRMPTVRCGGLEVVIDEVDDMLRDGGPSPSNSSLFAIPLGGASAQVSPLHFQSATFGHSEVQLEGSDTQPILLNSQGRQILPATTYNPWNVQQQSNHSPSREARLSRVDSVHTADKKSTAAMPGLEYDSGVDVDPQKFFVQKSTTQKQARSSPSMSAKEKFKLGKKSHTDIPHAAAPNPVDFVEKGKSKVKNLVALHQQSDIGHRLSNLEAAIKQEGIIERRRLEQEVLFVSANFLSALSSYF